MEANFLISFSKAQEKIHVFSKVVLFLVSPNYLYIALSNKSVKFKCFCKIYSQSHILLHYPFVPYVIKKKSHLSDLLNFKIHPELFLSSVVRAYTIINKKTYFKITFWLLTSFSMLSFLQISSSKSNYMFFSITLN